MFQLTHSFLVSELDIMNLFQQKQTSLYKPGMDLNQEMTNMKSHFSAIAITAAKETFLKSSLLEAPQPKAQLTGDSSVNSQKQPNPPKTLWHNQTTTQATVETVSLKDTITQLNNTGEPNPFADPLNQPATLRNSQTLLTTTLLPTTTSKPTQSTILFTSAINDQQEQQEVSSMFLDYMLSSTPRREEKKEIYLTSTAPMHHELSITPFRNLGLSRGNILDMISPTVDSTKTLVNSLQNGASQDMITVSPENLSDSELSSNFRIPFKASTGQDLQSSQVTEEVSTAVSTTGSLDLPVSKNEPLISRSFPTNVMASSLPFITTGIRDGEFSPWNTSAAMVGDDFPDRTEISTARIPAIRPTPVATTRDLYAKRLAKGSTTVEPHRLSVAQADLYDVSESGEIRPASFSLLNLKSRTAMIKNLDRENATAKQSMLNQTLVSTLSVSGFPVFQSSKRRPVCPYPPIPAHGTFYFHTIPNPAPFQYKHYIQYACYAGYTLANGDVYSYCLQDGQWSGVTPMCIGKPLLLPNIHSVTDLTRNAYTVLVMYVKVVCYIAVL